MSQRSWPLPLLLLMLISPLSLAQISLGEVAEDHADLAHTSYLAAYQGSLSLQASVETLLESPTQANLEAARNTWVASKDIYSQTEAFRFGHPPVDEWEPQVNAWPLDEGFIDYVVDDSYFFELSNPYGQLNLISAEDMTLGPDEISIREITPELLASLNELGGSEANVATGWHAIEFLLWGQDLHGNDPGAGERPASDFAVGADCSHGHCERRAEYLRAVTELLVQDLAVMVEQWQPDAANYRAEFLALAETEQMRRILYSVGSLSLGELAGERMRVALFANSAEDEQDCFSDMTHRTLYNNFQGVRNVLEGHFSAGAVSYQGSSVMGWLQANEPQLAERLEAALDQADARLGHMYQLAENGQRFDQLIGPGNREGAQVINQGIQSLVAATAAMVDAGAALGLSSFAPDTAGHF